ncbi:hypothetical protein F5X99DRAFT_423132 [Biscogniauxia marginata]|nr:hypothetical protein F5X99DRAFT_423132 [Biscogniauxia marginata]
MANRNLQLMTFSLSSKDSPLSLSASSMAFISNVPPPRVSSDELHHLIQAKQLWLLSSGLCRLEVIVELGDCQMAGPDSRRRFLEYIADAICQCSIWSALGLIVNQLAVHDSPLYDGDPNLYFNIEHPDKSYGLLSPSHIPAVYFQGLEFLLRFHSENRTSAPDDHDTSICFERNPRMHASTVPWEYTPSVLTDPWTGPHTEIITTQLQQEWAFAAHLVQAALHTTMGVKRPRGLQLVKEDDGTLPLLKIAPSVWNAHHLQLMATHARNFPVISNILAASVRGQSPALRRKAAELLEEDGTLEHQEFSNDNSNNVQLLESSIQRRLWGLLQTTLKPKVRTRGVNAKQSIMLPPNEPRIPSRDTTPEFQNPISLEEEYITSTGSGYNLESNPSWPYLPRNEERCDAMVLDTLEHWHAGYEEGDVEIPDRDMDIIIMDSRLESDCQLEQDLGDELYLSGDVVFENEYSFRDDFNDLEVDYNMQSDNQSENIV